MTSDQVTNGRILPTTKRWESVTWCSLLSRCWVGPLALLFALMLGIRLLAMAVVPLIPEEAYYWMYAQHPSLSYYDHPPMVAWVIGLGTAVFGDNEFGVRVVGSLLSIGASFLMYQFARAWFSHSAGVLAALLLQILPVYFGCGFIATMDSALVFFWMLCMVGVTSALRGNRSWGWYVAGVALGLAMLSKYIGVFLAAGTVLAVVSHRPWRRHLLTVHPYLALLLALVLFSPVVIWNVQHDWASFRFQFVDRWGGNPLSLSSILSFVGFQVVVVTPVVLLASGLLAARLFRGRHRLRAPRHIIALAFSLPLLLIMAYKSLRYGVHISWTIPAYLSLFPVVSQWSISKIRQGRTDPQRLAWRPLMAWTAILCIVINIGLSLYLITLQPRLQWISAFGPWKPLARIVEEYEDHLERDGKHEPLIVAEGKYRLASVLAFYRRPMEGDVNTADYTTSQWVFDGKGLGYPYWGDVDSWRGRDVLYVDDDNEDIPVRLWPHLEDVKEVADARLLKLGRKPYRLAIGKRLRLSTESMPN